MFTDQLYFVWRRLLSQFASSGVNEAQNDSVLKVFFTWCCSFTTDAQMSKIFK